MTTLTIDHINKSYGSLHILHNIKLDIAEGEFISLLGPSGCGKTTTLRCIAGFEQPDNGRILFGARDMTFAMPEQRDLGMVFQSYALFPHMTVYENLCFGLDVRKVSASECKRRIAETLQTVKLEGYEARYPRELSGGQQQRVALARALVIEPSVLLLDEPLANLDASLRDSMRFFIRDLQQRVGITTIYVTHDQGEAMVMSDRIVVMNKGVVTQFAEPREIYERPSSLSVASFIGQSNTVDGQVINKTAENYTVSTQYGEITAAGPDGFKKNDPVKIMIRPENINISGLGDNTLQGKVTKSVYQGDCCRITIQLMDGNEITTSVSTRSSCKSDDIVQFSFDAVNAWVLAV